jgi:hypothetical protein
MFCKKVVDLYQATWGDVPENGTFQLFYWSHDGKLSQLEASHHSFKIIHHSIQFFLHISIEI